MTKVANKLFTPAIRAQQANRGSSAMIERMQQQGHWKATLNPDQVAFIQRSDSCYLGSASLDGKPYIQHRGGPRGFVEVVNPGSLRFANYNGNRQYISLGNLSENDQAFLFFMDYNERRRLKLWGRAEVTENTEDARPAPSDSPRVEQFIRFDILAVDENCRRHIHPREGGDDCRQQLRQAHRLIAQLQVEIERLKSRDGG